MTQIQYSMVHLWFATDNKWQWHKLILTFGNRAHKKELVCIPYKLCTFWELSYQNISLESAQTIAHNSEQVGCCPKSPKLKSFFCRLYKEKVVIHRQSVVKTSQLKNIPSNNTFHILPFTYVTHDNPGYTLK